jgi:hypothetical protein
VILAVSLEEVELILFTGQGRVRFKDQIKLRVGVRIRGKD